jgi:plastocyanin
MKIFLKLLLLAAVVLPHSVSFARAVDEVIEIVEPGSLASWGYSPSRLTVPVGSTVTWRNAGNNAHSVTSQDQLFDSKLLDSGKSWSLTFDAPGTYRYYCVPNPVMKGVVVVVAPAEDRT